MSGIVLDASALIAMLLQERGAAKVSKAIAEARMCAVNHAEVVSHFAQLGMPADMIDAMLDPLPIRIVPADHDLSRRAGRLSAPGVVPLSLGDRFCLALAQRDGLPAWTCDSRWAEMANAAGVKVVHVK